MRRLNIAARRYKGGVLTSLALVSLSGCATLPKTGPQGHTIIKGATDGSYKLVEVDQLGAVPVAAQPASLQSLPAHQSNDVGAIAPGRYGDMIAVDGDPLADVRQLEHPTFVMKGGEVVRAIP